MAKKKVELDAETMEVIAWCTKVEELLIAAGASRDEAQDHIEENADWFTDMFYDGLTPEQAARETLNDPAQ
jgi:hypothetical protein